MLRSVLTQIHGGHVCVTRAAVALMPLTMIMVAMFVLVAPPALANEDELRIRKNQLVITSAAIDCSTDPATLHVEGRNFGSYVPHITIELTPVTDLVFPDPGAEEQVGTGLIPTAVAICAHSRSYLLTVMRTRVKYKHRWLKLTRKDLATFEVAIVGPAEVPDDLVDQINQNTDAIGSNAGDIGVNTAAIGVNTTGVGVNTTAIGANTTGVGVNATAIGGNTTAIAANTTNITANANAITALGGGGGGSTLLYVDATERFPLSPPPVFSVPAGTISTGPPLNSALRITAQGRLSADASSKTITCSFETQALASLTTTNSGGAWRFIGEVTPRGPSNVTAMGHMMLFATDGSLLDQTMISDDNIALSSGTFASTAVLIQCTLASPGEFFGVSQRSFLVELLQ